MGAKHVPLDDLTPELYLTYKKRKLSDKEIGRMCGCSRQRIGTWKKENGLCGFEIRNFVHYEKHTPSVIERLKKKYLSFYNQGWDFRSICEEMGMHHSTLEKFRMRYFPEHYKNNFMLTPEQRKTARENGLKYDTVRHRIYNGWSVERAITEPSERIRDRFGRFVPKDKIGGIAQ